jgi:MoaA/NifB/PqqE/SkfB family radical SAM enzyme
MSTGKLVKAALKCRFVTHKPVALTHTITTRCNARCDMCDYWRKPRTKELSKEEIFKILDDASDAGISQYTVWGGEPLIRKDTPEVIDYAKKKGMHTALITNGHLLDKRAKELKNVDALIVSLDYPNEKHDEQRHLPGTYRNAMKGIKKMKKYCDNIAINCVISKFNYGHEVEMAEFATKNKVKITFEPMQENDYNKDMALTDKEISESFEKILKLRKKHRIVNSPDYLEYKQGKKDFTCHAPKVFTTIDNVGDVKSCHMYGCKSLDNAKEKPLGEILNSKKYSKYIADAEKCGKKCHVSEMGECSALYEMKPRAFYNFVKNIVR